MCNLLVRAMLYGKQTIKITPHTYSKGKVQQRASPPHHNHCSKTLLFFCTQALGCFGISDLSSPLWKGWIITPLFWFILERSFVWYGRNRSYHDSPLPVFRLWPHKGVFTIKHLIVNLFRFSWQAMEKGPILHHHIRHLKKKKKTQSLQHTEASPHTCISLF